MSLLVPLPIRVPVVLVRNTFRRRESANHGPPIVVLPAELLAYSRSFPPGPPALPQP